jgi:uncharacterized membrane protein YfcA
MNMTDKDNRTTKSGVSSSGTAAGVGTTAASDGTGTTPADQSAKTGVTARAVDKLPIRERMRLAPETLKRLGLLASLYILTTGGIVAVFDFSTPDTAVVGPFVPAVMLLAFVFETMDSAAGMGFGTALSPVLLLVFGFDPLAVVPVLLISESITGVLSGWMHNEFENVAVSLSRPVNDETKAVGLITGVAALGTIVSVLLAYFAIQFDSAIINAYVTVLVFVMAVVALFREHFRPAADAEYRPRRLVGFAALAGFNKGIGGGGFGPVTTIGQLYSGVYEKAAAAISSLSEGLASLVGIITYFAIEAAGADLNFMLLPSILTGSFLAAVVAPYSVRVIPNRIYRYIIPGYAIAIGVFLLYSLFFL